MSRRIAILFLIFVFSVTGMSAQRKKRNAVQKPVVVEQPAAERRKSAEEEPPEEDYKEGLGWVILNGDTITTFNMAPIPVFAKKKDFRRYQRTVNAVKKVYPYAKDAREYLDMLEQELPKLKNDREREKFTKQVEKEIVKKYTPVLENMTRTEGKVLIKLIDRETEKTSYQILKDFRGGFAAGFWNTLARLFKANLKDTYDPEGEDKLIEQIIIYYEAGLI